VLNVPLKLRGVEKPNSENCFELRKNSLFSNIYVFSIEEISAKNFGPKPELGTTHVNIRYFPPEQHTDTLFCIFLSDELQFLWLYSLLASSHLKSAINLMRNYQERLGLQKLVMRTMRQKNANLLRCCCHELIFTSDLNYQV